MTFRPAIPRQLSSEIIKVSFALVALVLFGCSSVEETRLRTSVTASITQQIQQFDSADARAIVAARLKEGNQKFLGFAGEGKEPSFLPGLSQREIQQLIDLKKHQWEVFYYYHGRSELGSPEEEKALRTARLHYAERVNRELMNELVKELPAVNPGH